MAYIGILARVFVCFPTTITVRLYYRRIAILVACIVIISALAFHRYQPRQPTSERSLRVKYVKNVGNNTLACRLPTVDPFHPSILKFVKDLGKLRCEGKNYSSYQNGVLRIKGNGITSAQFRTIERPIGEDFYVNLSHPVDVPNRASKKTNQREEKVSKGLISRIWDFLTKVFDKNLEPFYGTASVQAEFIRVDVVTSSGNTETDLHMHVVPKKEAVERKLQPGGIPLDVALVMFDSTSAANFRRKLPSSLEYLTKNLKSVFFHGETIVGDGTTAQLCAMLTGIAEEKQPEARRDKGVLANPVDNWRWLFKDYEKKGYITMFSEDSALRAAFNYRLTGFKNPPTDHYTRPFWLEVANVRWDLCINSRAAHEVSLAYLLSFFRAYENKRKFTFVSHDAISHDDPNTLGYGDDALRDFLISMENESFLNNTFLIVFADHGPRFSEVRKSIQGKLEERFPFLSITVPKWFPEKYPELHSNLVHNSHILTTPFDVYATLRHILSYPEYPSGITTGQSLFTKIDGGNRTCANAGVEDHWCPCLNLEEVPIDEPVVRETADFIVNHINSLTSQNNELLKLCHRLVLAEVISAFRDMPSEGLQKFTESKRDEICDSCGLVLGRKSENTLVKDTLYQIQLITSPNEGFYEVTVRIKRGLPTLVGEISRLDSYKDQVQCIKSYPMVRKYCYCR